ncbi:Caskin-1 [Saguinus oedipus]|uniref:Caskin-1 n=1 Tax=Saguinus oedipus TaxID=9490 RepID=A0ABQ9UKP1_SAGOE|nr:Caskin-1 [Saguinus oedipus]
MEGHLPTGPRAGTEPSLPQGGSSSGPSAPPEEIWVLRKPFAGGERSGSVSGVAGGRGSGGQALHAGSEGVKLLATVLSQKSVSESSPGDSPVKPPEGSTGAARSQPPVAHAGQVYGEQPTKKLEPASEGKVQGLGGSQHGLWEEAVGLMGTYMACLAWLRQGAGDSQGGVWRTAAAPTPVEIQDEGRRVEDAPGGASGTAD